MSGLALVLVLFAAAVHASWNLAATRVPGGARFVFCYYTVSAVVLVPVGVAHLVVTGDRPRWAWLLAAAVTAVAHVAYGVVLQRGYAVGDLSVVYPLARGCGPLLSVLVAVAVLHERPGWPGFAGAVLVVGGVLVISAPRGPGDPGRRRAGAGYGVLTGVTIAAYTLWDAYAVGELGVPPVVYLAAGTVLQSLMLAPYALRGGGRRGDAGGSPRALWREHRRAVLLVGLLSPVAYVLVLFAMRLAPVSLVAPLREVSIVLGGLAGWLLLGEPHGGRRLAGSAIVLAGITAIALA
ncbi:EamA family transporter [Prauserella halophila]|uniref:EamA family transporter n=1 Tax=Prauserella halophila TaxID=185641 RepID=A0ABN1WEJ2_9PSEU|nr:DMT family transporter [Prauserella halophila]MCP2234722.1 EamA-like transporter family protein [Prauserella halophila]